MILRPAENLDEAWQTLSTRPLIDPAEFRAFYRDEVNAVRGDDQVALMAYGLRRSFGGERWFGVHPLVVDILKAHGKLKARRGEVVAGGTE